MSEYMGAMEVVLIIFGIVIFIGSFLIPAGKAKASEDMNAVTEETIKEMVGREVDEAKDRVTDIVDETINYAMEKTERSMDRLTNEKMLAINEYSDTVLEEINKNHKEVVFLYDMLNDKHENLKSTVSEAVKTATQVKQTVKDAEITAKETEEKVKEVQEEFQPITAPRVEIIRQPEAEQVPEKEPEAIPEPKKTSKKVHSSKARKETTETALPEIEVTLNPAGKKGGRNSNERILELHKAGKSNMAIAKELGLGLGEVKLVIDLFEGI